MTGSVAYSTGKLLIMAAACGLLLPLLSPIMLLTGPGAIVLVPLFLIGGPIFAVPCLIRAAGDRLAVAIGPDQILVRTLWRTVVAPIGDLVDVRVERDTVRWMLFVPISRKLHLVVVIGAQGASERSFRLPLNLLDLDERGALGFAAGAEARIQRRMR